MPYKDPEKQRIATRDSHRRRYQGSKQVAESIASTLRDALAVANGQPIASNRSPESVINSAQSTLALILQHKGLSTTKVVSKVKQRLNSKSFKLVDGKLQAIPDNDAQLKAVEIAMELQTRAGMLPSDRSNNGNGNINLQIISFNAVDSQPEVLELESLPADPQE